MLGLRARITRSQLDSRLASGEDHAGNAALSLRAAQLVSTRGREAVARALESVHSRRSSGQSVSAAIPVHEEALDGARPAIEQLIAALRSDEPVRPRGVALAAQLLTEPASPLYAPSSTCVLELSVRESIRALA